MSGTDGEEDYKALQSFGDEGDDDLGLFGDLSSFEGLALEEDAAESGSLCPQCLEKYKNPRVLSCLHVLCENCLKDLLAVDNEEDCENVIYSGRSKPHKAFIVCPLCKQETSAGERGLSSLHLDPVYQKKTASDSCLSGLICTSCKANEEAVAKCMDCDNLLCPNCYSAHKYMRCFDNHSVITFEELSQSGQSVPIKRNPNCPRHPTESFKYYCNTCQVATCTQCLNTFHLALEHRTERLTDAEARCRAELKQFSEEISVRQNSCRVNANKLEKMLGELQHQHDAAKSTISEVHEAYIALLEKKREQALEELEALHSKQELSIMEACQRVDRTRDRIQTALRYTKVLLSEAEPAGLLHLSASIKAQMQLLHNAASRTDEVDVLLKFESNPSRFEEALNGSYGYFVQRGSSGVSSSGVPSKPVSSLGLPTPSSTPLPPSPTHSSPLESQPPQSGSLSNIGYGLSSGMLKNDLTHSVLLSSMADMTNAPPDLSAALSLSSFTNSMTSSSSSPSMRALDLNSLGSVGSMTSIQEYNLQQLASLAGKAECQNSIQQHHHLQQHQRQQAGLPPPRGTPSPHTTSPFTLADLLAGDMNVTSHAFTNLQALAKLGSHSSLGMDALGGASHGVSSLGNSGMQSLGTNLGLLVNGSGSSVSHNGGLGGPPLSPHDASLLASALSAPPFIPSNSPRPSSAVSASSSASFTAGSSSGTLASNPKYIPMQTRVRFGQLGSAKGQFNSPHGFCLGVDEDIVVADTNNHRIQIFDKDGLFKHDFGNPGKEEGQLWYPRKVAVIRQSGKIVVCDRGNERSRMQIFSRTGQFIKRIVIRYIDIVAGLAINEQGHIVAVDSVSPTVFRITENGELIKWFDVSDRMREPSDLAIHGKEYYICDFKGHCVVVFNEEGEYVRRIGCESITNFPNGIDISDAGDVLIGDSHGNRFHVAVFSRNGSLLSEFECPHVKVSRCCGLKITSEGFVVTLAKNNHYVLVLNTLYIA
ncbi:brain tumor protein-like isoform X2 [Daphnia pulicaria]|uniref:brain tumor protein-like isoform X2 n=1 Tax=Daphnia pulicaria TaxID=35523 RepID=UPI001EECAF4A|nr:brain tumor protein-like isoform X2 [Daphnia pulicaria]